MKKFKFMRFHFLFLSLLIIPVFIPSIVHTAQIMVPFEEIVQTADLIFIGTVDKQHSRLNELHTITFTDVYFQDIVIIHATDRSVQKGLPVIRLTYAGGCVEDTCVTVTDTTSFEDGHRYLIFALDDGNTYLNPVVGGIQGVFEVVNDFTTPDRAVLATERMPASVSKLSLEACIASLRNTALRLPVRQKLLHRNEQSRAIDTLATEINICEIYNQCMMTLNQFTAEPDDTLSTLHGYNTSYGFVDDETLLSLFQCQWDGALARTIILSENPEDPYSVGDNRAEIYMIFNPHYAWTDDIDVAINNPDSYLFRRVCMHELAHAWGLSTELCGYDSLTVTCPYDRNHIEDGCGIHWKDAYLLRRSHRNQAAISPLRDVGVESYYPTGTGAINNSLTAGSSHQDFQDTFHSGDLLTLRGVYAENLSSEAASNVRIRFFLSMDRHIDPSDYQMINAEDELPYYWEWETFAGESSTLEDYTCRIPSGIPPGKYYVGVMATIDGFSEDDYTDNNQTTFYSPIIIIQTPSITIISPQGGESWAAGSRQTIRWNYTESPGSYVKIELFKGGIFSRIITSSYSIGTSGSGSYNWTIPTTLTPASDYQVKVTSSSNSAYTNLSDFFSITPLPPPGITITSPLAGENWTAGTRQTISWTYEGNTGSYVKIELLKGGTLDSTITSSYSVGTNGNGSYNWTIPNTLTPGSDYQVKITSTSTSSCTDTSDSFTIGPPTITVTAPAGGSVWTAGSRETIRWNYTGNPGSSVKIELLKSGALDRTIASSYSIGANGSGSYNWTIPTTLTPASDYQVKVTSKSNSAWTDTSDFFTIGPPSITVTAPAVGAVWTGGNRETIRWSYTGNPGSSVKIELLKGGALDRTIASSYSIGANGSGSYNWTIPATQTPGSDYQVKVTSTSNSACTDTSDFFTIGPPSITITAPQAGENWTAGNRQTIRWSYTGNPGTSVKIELLKGGALNSTITSSYSAGTNGSGSYGWTIPITQTIGSDYQIRVTSTSNSACTDTSGSFTISPPSLTITAPTGVDVWETGSKQTIRWSFTGNSSSYVKIELFKGGSVDSTITPGFSIGTNGNGSFTWTIPAAKTPGNDYQIKITSTTISAWTDTSDFFTISPPPPPTITVTAPNAGVSWALGSRQIITWRYTGNTGSSVKIALLKGGTVNSTITSGYSVGTNGSGSYNWTIPSTQASGNDYQVMVTSTTVSSCTDESTCCFTIASPTITVTTPTGTDDWKTGSRQTIKWSYTGNPGSYVKVELLKGGAVNSTITPGCSIGTNGTGSFSWIIPTSQANSSDYQIRVTSTTNSSYTDTSDCCLTISPPPPPTITVTAPTGTDNWETGSRKTISWSYTGNPGSYVKVELLKGGSVNSTITSSYSVGTNGSGSYSWTIPSAQASGNDYQIKITSTTNSSYTDTSDCCLTISPPPPPAITVIAPDAGVSWALGSRQTISWSYIGNPGTSVKINLLKGGAVNSTITSGYSVGTNGSGSYSWTIPSTQAPGNDYQVMVTSTTVSACTDESTCCFTITSPTITVTTPTGTDDWETGSRQTISWSYTGNPGSYVKIDLLKGGSVDSTVTPGCSIGTNGIGSFSWIIPNSQATGSNYQVRVTSTTNSSYTDTSDCCLTISPPPPPSITVTAPNGGENWGSGSKQTISWSYAGNPGSYVKIELLKGGSVNSTITSGYSIGTNGTGSYSWTLPTISTLGNDYQIRVTSTANSAYTDTSDDYFTISPPGITVTAPNRDEVWGAGTRQIITWTYTGYTGPSVKIELLKGSSVDTIITSSYSIGTEGTGSYNWTIPSTQATGNDYRIRVTSTTNSAYTDTSDSYFTISIPSYTVTSPDGGENWTAGTQHTITWNYAGTSGTYVNIELLKGGVLNRIIYTYVPVGTDGTGSYVWIIPSIQTPGTDYTVRVSSTINSSWNDMSNNNFSISAP